LVYAGAIMVLFLFVLMLLNLTPEELREEISARRKLGAAVASASLFALLTRTVWTSPAVRNAGDLAGELGETLADIGETREIAESLFSAHLLPFELTSFLILIAVVAALYLTGVRRRTEEGPSPEESP
ncbi:MAG: NADH-quinone oxidoreductase subunit J, partial [Planctomycetota bacterium]|nr:NADH-quinone oxidoreductase subunit J [Planctomycetota bacterium]